MPRRRPEFVPGAAGAEAAKFKKFSDAGGSQILWLSDAGRADFSITSGIVCIKKKAFEIAAFRVENGDGVVVRLAVPL